MDSEIISFKEVEDKDLVFLKDDLLCTIDYFGDYDVEKTREIIRFAIRKIIFVEDKSDGESKEN